MGYNMQMNQVVETDRFKSWFGSLRDRLAKAAIQARIRRIGLGNFGDCTPVGEGVSELRIHHGPGYRIYIKQHGLELVILLAGGDKSTQKRDIADALEIARSIKENKDVS